MDHTYIGRGLRLNGEIVFTEKRVHVEPDPGGGTHLRWTWPSATAYQHLDWFLGLLCDRFPTEILMGDLHHWQTTDLATETTRTIHGWPTTITVDIPHEGKRATLHIHLRPIDDIHG
jgi:hypothetical protein